MPDETLTLDPDAAEPVDKSAARVRQMFAEIAPRYDFLNHVLSAGTDYYWRWLTVRRAPPLGPAPVLDVCTGTGDLAIAYWKYGRGRTPVVGADFCYPMLVRGLAKAIRAGAAKATDTIATDTIATDTTATDTNGASQGATTIAAAPSAATPGVSFVEADTERLPFADEHFQIVSVAFGLRNVSDTRRGIAEMVRVLQKDGRLVVLEFSLPGWAPLRAAYLWYFRNVLPRIGQALGRNRQGAYNYLPQSVGQFPYGQALADMFRAAGLREVRFWPLSFGVATLYVGRK
jgi:demethylmenaquinone methyltransferase/2-methoxy-6-polyprenyl-1,4-benzoquinol methylase